MDKQGGGYFNTPGEDPSVLLHVKEDYDGAEPSGNSVAAINLIRLSSIFDASKSTGYKRNVEHLLVCGYFMLGHITTFQQQLDVIHYFQYHSHRFCTPSLNHSHKVLGVTGSRVDG